MLTEGVDIPDAKCIIGARPTKSLTLYLQMVGRGLRKKADGSDLIILDCAGWMMEHGSPSSPKTWSLDPDVDPNQLKLRNKIVAKDKDGHITEKTDAFMELLEMSPEEYMEKLAGGKDIAVKKNQTIDEKVAEMWQQILNAFKELIKDFDRSPYMMTHWDDDMINQILIYHKDSYDPNRRWGKKIRSSDTYLQINLLDAEKTVFATLLNGLSDYPRQVFALNNYITLSKLLGVLNGKLPEKDFKKIFATIDQINKLLKTRVNLSSFDEKAKELKENQWRLALDNFIETHSGVVFKEPLYIDNFFKKSDLPGKCRSIIFPSKKINNHHNTVLLGMETSHRSWDSEVRENKWTIKNVSIEKKFVPGDKIIEMIKAGGWNAEDISAQS